MAYFLVFRDKYLDTYKIEEFSSRDEAMAIRRYFQSDPAFQGEVVFAIANSLEGLLEGYGEYAPKIQGLTLSSRVADNRTIHAWHHDPQAWKEILKELQWRADQLSLRLIAESNGQVQELRSEYNGDGIWMLTLGSTKSERYAIIDFEINGPYEYSLVEEDEFGPCLFGSAAVDNTRESRDAAVKAIKDFLLETP